MNMSPVFTMKIAVNNSLHNFVSYLLGSPFQLYGMRFLDYVSASLEQLLCFSKSESP